MKGTTMKADALKVTDVFGGWYSGFAVDVTYTGGEWKRVHLDRDLLVKEDGTYDLGYVATAVEQAAPDLAEQ